MHRSVTSGIQTEPSAQAASDEIEQTQPTALGSLWAFLSGPYPTLVSRLALGLIFLLSGLTKLGVPDAFQASIESYEMPLPSALVHLMAVGLPPLELGIGAWLVIGLFVRFSAGVSAGLLVIFLIAMIQAVFRGLDPNCGCFLGGPQENPLATNIIRALGPLGTWLTEEKVGVGSVTRDVVFLLMSIHLLFVPTIFALDNLRNRSQESGVGDHEEEEYDEEEEEYEAEEPTPNP